MHAYINSFIHPYVVASIHQHIRTTQQPYISARVRACAHADARPSCRANAPAKNVGPGGAAGLSRRAYLSCDIHTHTPARKSSTDCQLYYCVIQMCYANCLGHGHGYECHSPLPSTSPLITLPQRRSVSLQRTGPQAKTRRLQIVGKLLMDLGVPPLDI